MRVDQKIQQIVQTIQGLNYQYNDWTRANITLDNQALPVCLYILPVSGTLYNKNNNLRDQPNALIAFLDKAELDYDGPENQLTVENMKQYAKQFITKTNQSKMFQPLSENIPYTVVYDTLDANLTGIVIQVTLKEQQGSCTR